MVTFQRDHRSFQFRLPLIKDAGGPQWPGKENGAMSTWTLADPVRDTALSKWTPSFLGHLSPLALSASQPQVHAQLQPTVTGSLPPCNLAHDQTNDLTIATCTDIFRRCESYIGLARRASRCIEPR
ncbi:Uncharacterized protein TCM_026850 [Theobroma cacao]|uniref:Uncharacterized protein n=1 Tax=Theobroma cacao TaxID=3641 RepID=A0A061FBC4_THECC|nr:Uncharacterized protein TCM_026850 [Theobroma cacao]